MAAAVAISTRIQRFFDRDASLLTEAWQRVVFAENCDERAAVTRLAHHRNRQACHCPRDAKTLCLQHRHVLCTGSVLLIVQLGSFPNTVAQGKEGRTLLIDQIPNPLPVLHGTAAPSWSACIGEKAPGVLAGTKIGAKLACKPHWLIPGYHPLQRANGNHEDELISQTWNTSRWSRLLK